MCSFFNTLGSEAKSGLIGAFLGALIPILASGISYCYISYKETKSAEGIAEQLSRDLETLIVEPDQWDFDEFKDRQLIAKSSVYMAEQTGTLIYRRLDADAISKIEKTKRILYHFSDRCDGYEKERGNVSLDDWSKNKLPESMSYLTRIIRNRASKSLGLKPRE